jgi:diadenosine tetraphosphate (Ap4A) HIT family hydrolase
MIKERKRVKMLLNANNDGLKTLGFIKVIKNSIFPHLHIHPFTRRDNKSKSSLQSVDTAFWKDAYKLYKDCHCS